MQFHSSTSSWLCSPYAWWFDVALGCDNNSIGKRLSWSLWIVDKPSGDDCSARLCDQLGIAWRLTVRDWAGGTLWNISLSDWLVLYFLFIFLLTTLGLLYVGQKNSDQTSVSSWYMPPRLFQRSAQDMGRWTGYSEKVFGLVDKVYLSSLNQQELKLMTEPRPRKAWKNQARDSGNRWALVWIDWKVIELVNSRWFCGLSYRFLCPCQCI